VHFLLTNDDGVDAAGLAALLSAAERTGKCTIVAPDRCWSGCSHVVTTDEAFRVRSLGPAKFVVEAAPADCARIGVAHLAPDVDCVLSGVNHGGNLGADIHLSGTVAAVREAVIHGKRGIAFSQYRRKGEPPPGWERASRWIAGLLPRLLEQSPGPGAFWNVNLPHLPEDFPDPEVIVCEVDRSPLPVNYHVEGDVWKYAGNYHSRPRLDDGDIACCFGGAITVSEVRVW
jgi:5'-nucleotidase